MSMSCQDPMLNTVIIISANTEWKAIRELFPSAPVFRQPYGEWFNARAGRFPVRFVHGGWGKISAAASAQYAITAWTPDLLMNLGTCGGFHGFVDPMTTILVNRTVVYDILEQMGDHDAHIQHYTTRMDLSWLNRPYPEQVLETGLVSGDRDLLPEEILSLNARYGVVAGDWESAAIAWTAGRNGVPCLILRGVSDLVSTESGEAYEGNMDVYITNTRRIIHRRVSMLPAWLELAADGLGQDLTGE